MLAATTQRCYSKVRKIIKRTANILHPSDTAANSALIGSMLGLRMTWEWMANRKELDKLLQNPACPRRHATPTNLAQIILYSFNSFQSPVIVDIPHQFPPTPPETSAWTLQCCSLFGEEESFTRLFTHGLLLLRPLRRVLTVLCEACALRKPPSWPNAVV